MRFPYTACLLVSVLLASTPALAETRRVGTIDFYGLGKVTEEQVRTALGFSEGDVLPDSISEIQQRLSKIPGVFQAHLQAVCCVADASVEIYVGIDEFEAGSFQYRPAPQADIKLPRKIVTAYKKFWKAFYERDLRPRGPARHGTPSPPIHAGHGEAR